MGLVLYGFGVVGLTVLCDVARRAPDKAHEVLLIVGKFLGIPCAVLFQLGADSVRCGCVAEVVRLNLCADLWNPMKDIAFAIAGMVAIEYALAGKPQLEAVERCPIKGIGIDIWFHVFMCFLFGSGGFPPRFSPRVESGESLRRG